MKAAALRDFLESLLRIGGVQSARHMGLGELLLANWVWFAAAIAVVGGGAYLVDNYIRRTPAGILVATVALIFGLIFFAVKFAQWAWYA